MNMLRTALLAFFFISFQCLQAQVEPSPFDFGRMWTFEQPPKEWFQEAYGMDTDEAWFEEVRKSSLRFASWCSASFVSPHGLIMTNHHCSRDQAISVQQGDENFDKNGYYAVNQDDERRVADLYVEQLVKIADITDEVMTAKSKAASESDVPEIVASTLETIKSKYEAKAEWSGLRLQTVSFYSGGKYSLYGYKKYEDIRLVLIPENDLGFYGGDPDNFTYPRYNLDCTFWRAYDEDGKPLDTSDHYYAFNIDGVEEGTPVFVVGNPGRTERYRTVAQLNYDRDYRFKHLLHWLTNRRDMMQDDYDVMSMDESKVREAQELYGTINNLSNSIKAYNGIMGGLHNDKFMGRKAAMEELIKEKSNGVTAWDDLANQFKNLEPHAWAVNHLGPTPYRGSAYVLMHDIDKYYDLLNDGGAKDDLDESMESIKEKLSGMDTKKEKVMLTTLLNEIKTDIYPGDNTLTRLLNGKSINGFVDGLFSESKLLKGEKEALKFLSKTKKFKKGKDPMQKAAKVMTERYEEAGGIYGSLHPKVKALEAQIANQAFNVFGTNLPPDATFTLRISDGTVKGYEYNGTVAPVKTTYFGMYDRYYSNNGKFPWSLPEKWQSPPMEMLSYPINFVSTNDIIGGNSGSAIINQKGEAVGLVFDGNIESLPGNFIFDEEYNRTVSVHAGGIYAAMKYIYKAERLVKELLPNGE